MPCVDAYEWDVRVYECGGGAAGVGFYAVYAVPFPWPRGWEQGGEVLIGSAGADWFYSHLPSG